MKQINCTVQGKATDTPHLVVDNGHPYLGQFESPTRVIFPVADAEPPWGATIYFGSHSLRYVIPEQPGAYEGPVLSYAPATPEIQIVDDHFEVNGKRWLVRGADGFCDLAVLLDNGHSGLVPQLAQARDLGVRVRRVFACIKNIRIFNPFTYGPAYYDAIMELFALYAEYGIYGDFDGLVDTGYWGFSLGQCQSLWNQQIATLTPITNKFNVSLTNEFDHGGNIVGTVNDYARPPFALCSQGSAVSDAPPPRPGWGIREFHCLKDWPKIFLCEDMLFNREGVDADGHAWGPRKPTYLSECPRFEEGLPQTDERLARTLALESVAFGEGLIFHNEFGKDGRLMGARTARSCGVAMDLLAKVEG